MAEEQNKEKIQLGGVEETLLIPLYARAVEAMKENARVKDEKALEIMNSIDYDFSKFQSSFLSKAGIVARTIILDREAKKFIENNPNGIVISVGCGLDTRLSRIDNGTVHWYDLDFPEVIELRRRFFQENERCKMIPKSCLDESWVNDIDLQDGQNVLLIMEGLLMYFTEDEVMNLFSLLKRSFPHCTILCELMCQFCVNHQEHHDSVPKTGAKFKWGCDYAKDLEKKIEGIHCDGDINFSDEMGWFIGIIFRIVNNHIGIFHFD